MLHNFIFDIGKNYEKPGHFAAAPAAFNRATDSY
jgi:hypothetical protein